MNIQQAFPQQPVANSWRLCCAPIEGTPRALQHLKRSKPVNLLTKHPPQTSVFCALEYYIFICHLQNLLGRGSLYLFFSSCSWL